MRTRLVEVEHTPQSHAVMLVVVALLFLFVPPISAVLAIGNEDAARPYVDIRLKWATILAGVGVAVGYGLIFLVYVATGLRRLGALYGWTRGDRVWIGTPIGMMGYWRQRMAVSKGVVAVRTEAVRTPAAPFLKYGPQVLYVCQGSKRVRTSTIGRYDPRTWATLSQWLEQYEVVVTVESSEREQVQWGL